MKTLFGPRRKNIAVEAMQNGTPVRIGVVPLFLPRRRDNIQLNARHMMNPGYQNTAIPLLWHTETRDVRVGGLWFLADHPTHLWASGVIHGGSYSNTIIDAIVDGEDMWVRPHLTFDPDKDLHRGIVSRWRLTAVSITDKQQYGFWPYATDTPIQALPQNNLESQLY